MASKSKDVGKAAHPVRVRVFASFSEGVDGERAALVWGASGSPTTVEAIDATDHDGETDVGAWFWLDIIPPRRGADQATVTTIDLSSSETA